MQEDQMGAAPAPAQNYRFKASKTIPTGPVFVIIEPDQNPDDIPSEFFPKAEFQAMDKSTLQRYRDIWTGKVGRSKGNPKAAQRFLCTEKFVQFHNFDTECPGVSDLEWLLHDQELGGLYFEYIMPRYIERAIPDFVDTKE